MPNRLAQETSPYLRQHVDNPVEWFPWGDEAFARARAENRPVFLSIGYSSCHWCHVMAHESFEDLEVASQLNRGFVCVKVDREEFPDVDEAYMTAVQLQSGRGGWPLSAFLTPDRSPFFAATYFPKPSFLSLIGQVSAAWESRREEVKASAREFREALESSFSRPAPLARGRLDAAFLESAFRSIESEFDPVHGGFGGAPKFPPHAVLEFLLAYGDSTRAGTAARESARYMALFTLEKMALGGIHDHVGGGFHRYSTDSVWLVPHFEKMLYDNALMLGNLARAAELSAPGQAPLFEAAREGIVDWLEREMKTADGLFGAALDADSEGEEGKFYVWTEDEAAAALGDRAKPFMAAFCFQAEGNFLDEASQRRTGGNIPHRAEWDGRLFTEERAAMRELRATRPSPLFDHKALVGLNGMAAVGLMRAGRSDLADLILAALDRAGGPGLPRQITAGVASGVGYLEDYAGLLLAHASSGTGELHRFESRWGSREAFRDPRAGDFFTTTEAHEPLFGRTKPNFDQPVPGGNALMARALHRLGQVDEARRIVEANLGWIERAPSSTAGLLLAGLEILERESDR